jgi:hypothetical protein
MPADGEPTPKFIMEVLFLLSWATAQYPDRIFAPVISANISTYLGKLTSRIFEPNSLTLDPVYRSSVSRAWVSGFKLLGIIYPLFEYVL